MTDFDVDEARRQTPGCAEVIHLNNAGAGLMPLPVLDACLNYLRLESRIGGYEAAALEAGRIEQLYDLAASLIGAERDEIAVVDSGTRAWDMAFYGIKLNPGDRILTSNVEYASNYIAMLHIAERTGAKIEVIPDDETGQVSVASLREMVDDRVRVISLVHVPTNGGLVNPAAEVGKVARSVEAIYLLDAVQSVGQLPVDVASIGCDVLAATSRKYLRGPRGIGFLYVRRGLIEMLDPPMLDLHSASWEDPTTYEIRKDARRFELWEKNYAAHVGLAAAIEYAQRWGLEAIKKRVYGLADRLRVRLAEVPGVQVQDLGVERCGIVTFTVEGHSALQVTEQLAQRGINISASRARSTRIDMAARGLDAVVRASLHYYNTEAELDRLRDLIAGL